jgi:succinate dehydrogenase hydrophobic anchor subunit
MRSKDRQRLLRDDWILMRVTLVVLVLVATAFMVMVVVLIATHM